MSPLEIKRKKLELIQVAAARNGLEFRIEELQEEISRVQTHIGVQEAREATLTKEIADAEAAAKAALDTKATTK